MEDRPSLMAPWAGPVGALSWRFTITLLEWLQLRRQPWWRPLRRAIKRHFRQVDPERLVREESPHGGSLSYGETPFLSVVHALRSAAPPPGSRFVDLGSGRGIPCLTAAALGWPAVGLEYFPQYVEGCRQIAEALSLPAHFELADITAAEWPEGEIYWISSTLRERLLGRLEQLPAGTLVITQDWPLPAPYALERMQVLPVSWGMARFCYHHREESRDA